MQSFTSVALPLQFFPPFIALGLEHDRERVTDPFPHDVLHDVQSVQAAHAPSTETLFDFTKRYSVLLVPKRLDIFAFRVLLFLEFLS